MLATMYRDTIVSTYGEREELAINATGLKDIKCGKTFGDTQTIILLVVNDQLRCLPMIEIATWIVLDPGIQRSLSECLFGFVGSLVLGCRVPWGTTQVLKQRC
jgi:hypothetical protein